MVGLARAIDFANYKSCVTNTIRIRIFPQRAPAKVGSNLNLGNHLGKVRTLTCNFFFQFS